MLVVEGSPGEGDTLVDALNAGGVATETVDVEEIPDVQQLVTYSSIVLVDVDARSLSGDRIDGVDHGGARSRSRAGDHRRANAATASAATASTPLEELLPVTARSSTRSGARPSPRCCRSTSAVRWPTATATKASIAAGRVDGGVNKTDISRAAAERTIEALSASDEIGVLAWNRSSKWVIDLQQLAADDVVEEGLRQLVPAGSTNLADSLDEAADALRSRRQS